ncbi:MAG: GLPGLI family protein [Chryseolinea sp.]
MKLTKLIIGILVSLAAGHMVFGQSNEGVIDYEVRIDLHRTLPSDRPELKSTVPNFRTTHQQLFFNSNESMYKAVESDDDGDFDSDGGGMRIKLQQPQVEIYFDRATSKRITQQEFNGKMYVIEDTLSMTPWKFGTETKVIIGYDCKQATYYNEERKQNVVAWFTPKLRSSLGPDHFLTLPGTILEVNINEGERIITAQSLTSRRLKKGDIKRPTQGIKITHEEFRRMVEQQMERMRANGGNMIIRN